MYTPRPYRQPRLTRLAVARMTESFYEPLDHWTDSIGYDGGYTMSIEERLAAEPVSYEDLEESWQAYKEDLGESWQAYKEDIQYGGHTPARRPTRATRTPWQALTDYLLTTHQTFFTVTIRDSTIHGRLQTISGEPYMTTLPHTVGPTESDDVYYSYESFSCPRHLVNHLATVCGYSDIDDDDDPLNYISTHGEQSKTWARISSELSNLE
jgi:hypothetical protein